MKKEERRNNRRSGGKVASGIVVLGAAGLLYSRFMPGTGIGLLPEEGNEPGQTTVSQQTMVAEEVLPEEAIMEEAENSEAQDVLEENLEISEQKYDYSADNILSIEVNEDKIIYEGEEITAADLEEKLLSDVREGVSVSLTDNHARKGTFDEVKAILSKLSLIGT